MAAAPVARILDLLAEVLTTEKPANVDRNRDARPALGAGGGVARAGNPV